MTYKFDESKHVHTLDGKRLHGVTSVLKYWGDPGGLINWAANQAVDYIKKGGDLEEARTAHTRKRDKAGDIGTKVHAELEEMMNAWIDKKAHVISNPVVRDVYLWLKREAITPLKSEMHVYSRDHWYGGIADGVIEKDGKKYILDFKTSNYIYTTAFIQCGAYSTAVKEMKESAEIGGVVIVHIPKGKKFDPEKHVYWRYDIENLETMWLNILETYKLDKELHKVIWKK